MKNGRRILNGKILVFSDIHCGMKNNSRKKLEVFIKTMKDIIDAVLKNGISHVIFCGDFFDSRNTIDVNTYITGYKYLKMLADSVEVYMIVGNHDMYEKNSTEINSVIPMGSIRNVHIVSEPEEIVVNGKKGLLAPYITDFSSFKKNSYDFLFAHLETNQIDISKYRSRINTESTRVTESIERKIDTCPELIGTSNTSQQQKKEIDPELYIEIVKEGGYIFSGHLHKREEMTVNGRNLIFIGSPFQTKSDEYDIKNGYYTIDENDSPSFSFLNDLPRYVIVKISDIVKDGIDGFDYSVMNGNIVKLIYDVKISDVDDITIQGKVSSSGRFEEVASEKYKEAMVVETDGMDGIDFKDSGNIMDNIKEYIYDESTRWDNKEITKDMVYNKILSIHNDIMGI